MRKKKKVVLASASPRRKELLSMIGLDFVVDAADYEEEMDIKMTPSEVAKYLSGRKAKAVAPRHRNAVIIAADTFIVFRGALMGKPLDEKDARLMLGRLSGKTHSVITGYTILDTDSGRRISGAVETKVSFRRLSAEEIDKYVKSKEPLDKAGAYAIQGLGSVLVKKIDGDYFNVIGLPLGSLVENLKKFGIYL